MPSVIAGIIPKQGFEICRDAIGAIILVELTNQKTSQGNAFPEDIIVLAESLIPADAVDQVSINVLLDSANYSQQTQIDSQGRTLYFIDIYTSGINSADSAFRRDKFLGMIGYIFRSAQYRLLGQTPGWIGGTYVESFATLDPSKKEDTNFTSFARIQLAVRIQEEGQAWTGVPFEINNTSVVLTETEKGYQYIFNN